MRDFIKFNKDALITSIAALYFFLMSCFLSYIINVLDNFILQIGALIIGFYLTFFIPWFLNKKYMIIDKVYDWVERD